MKMHLSSGRKGPIAWQTSSVNVQRTRDALAVLLKDFVVNPAYRNVVSVQPLNEPAGYIGGNMLDVLLQFYCKLGDKYWVTRQLMCLLLSTDRRYIRYVGISPKLIRH